MKSHRARRKLSDHELARFLDLLAQTGNFALACDRLGRAKSGLYKRRQRDPLFDADCRGALARARPRSWRQPGGKRHATHDKPAIVLSSYRGRPQLRRAAPGTLTQAGRERFLFALCRSGNIRFSAASVGVAHSSIRYRERTDPAFAAELRAALETFGACLELDLIAASGAFDCAPEDGDQPEPVSRFTARMTIGQAIKLMGKLNKQ